MAPPLPPPVVVLWVFHQSCYYHRIGKGTLTKCLRSYPMDEQVLIEELDNHFFAWARGEEGINHTVLVDLYELEHHRHPASLLEEAQGELLEQIRYLHADNGPYILWHKSRFQPHALTEEEKEFLRLYPTGEIPFSLPFRPGASHSVITSAHAQSKSAIEPSQQRQDDKASNPDQVVVPASISEKQSSTLDPANSRTITMPLRAGAQRSISSTLEPNKQHHGFQVLRSQTRINRANFFGRYQGQRTNL